MKVRASSGWELFFGKWFSAALLSAVACSTAAGFSPIKEDAKGILVYKVEEGSSRLAVPELFARFSRDTVYAAVGTPDGKLRHILVTQVVKVVFFLKPETFPTLLSPEDLALVKAKLGELDALRAVAPETEKLFAAHQKFLREIYASETEKNRQAAVASGRKFESEQEREAFERKCEVLRLSLVSQDGDIAEKEKIAKEMETLVADNAMLGGVLAKWKEEKSRALKLADEGRRLWNDTLKAHPKNFAEARRLQDVPDFPPDAREKIAEMLSRLDEFAGSVSFPKTESYCEAESRAYFLLNALADLTEKIRAGKFAEASVLGKKSHVTAEMIAEPYKPVRMTYESYTSLVDGLLLRFNQQFKKTKQAEEEATLSDAELLAEYRKAYDIMPSPKAAAKIQYFKDRLGIK